MIKQTFSLIFIGLILFLAISNCQAFDYNYANPIPHNSLTSLLTDAILVNIQNIVGWLAVIFIVIGGVLYMTAGGKDSQLTLAKNTIVASLIGLALALGGPSLLREIKDIFASGDSPPEFEDANTVYEILVNILDFVLTLIVILASLALIYSGLSYLGAGGDNSRIDKAKKIFIYSIASLSIAGGSLILIRFILSLLKGTL